MQQGLGFGSFEASGFLGFIALRFLDCRGRGLGNTCGVGIVIRQGPYI